MQPRLLELIVIDFKLSEVASLAFASLIGQDLIISKVSTDSRDCAGALFIALKGEKFDGHDFIDKAVANGAVAVALSTDRPLNVPKVICKDTLRFLGLCGLCVRRKSKAFVVSLTGSCGKTTVKEYTNSILSLKGKSIATNGNFNNDVGVPLTLLRLQEDTDFAVIEQGASHPLDIARTSEFVESKVALINNVGIAHLDGFITQEGIYRGKSEILDNVYARKGIGIVCADSPWYKNWCFDYAQEKTEGRLLSFGFSQDADVRLINLKAALDKLDFDLLIYGQNIHIELPVIGEHNALNAAAAASLAVSAGASLEEIRQGLNQSKNLSGRLSLKDYGNFILIDDAYNASFNAVIAALKTLSLCKGHRVFIFGDMGELGKQASDFHSQVGECAAKYVDEMLCVGPLSSFSVKACGYKAKHFNCHADLVKYALGLMNSTYCSFLVKGSHAMHMQTISEEIIAHGDKK